MTRRIMFLALLLLIPGPRASSAAEPDKPTWPRYEVVIENNIFMKSRVVRRPDSGADNGPQERPVYHVERDLLLTGISRRGDRYTAFIEDLRSNTTTRVAVGERAGEGTVTSIELDHLVFSQGEVTRRIEVGQTLAGDGKSASGSSAPGTSTPAGDPPTGTTGLDPDDEKAILERLRQQRMKELKQK